MERELHLDGRAEEILNFRENADEISKVLAELAKELESDDKLLALSAPQLGHNLRIIAMKFADKIEFIVNPLIVHKEHLTISRETNPQCEGEYLIPRFEKVELIYMLSSGLPKQIEFTGLAAYLFQQMNDILEGLQISDYGLPIDSDFDELTEDEKEEVITKYMDSLQVLQDKLKEDINNDDELRSQQNTIDFLTSVALGNTKVKPKYPNRETRRKQEKMAKRMRRIMNE